MTVQVRIEHCNETVPKTLIVNTVEQATGKIVSSIPIGPGIQRVIPIYDTVRIEIIEAGNEFDREIFEESE